jgi:hypothetical protein
MNPTQKMPDFRSGQPLRADALNHIVAAVLRMVVGGKGINIKSAAGKIVVEAEGQPIPRGGGGSAEPELWCKVATTKAGLEEPVAEIYFGRVTAGDDKGMVCVRNPDNDGWNAFTHFE